MQNQKEIIQNMSLDEKKQLVRQFFAHKEVESGSIPQQSLPADCDDFSQFPEYLAIQEQYKLMDKLKIKNLYFNSHTTANGNTIECEGEELINFSGYNYLGFAGSQEINAATKAAIDQYGTSVSASRIISGEIDLHGELERLLAKVIGTEACLTLVSGYGTNLSTIGYLMRKGDVIFYDELSHNSVIAGCIQSGARRISFPHNDWHALDALMQEHRGAHARALVVVEGVYSMDGDIAPLPALIAVKKKHRALLMVDEAHSMGVLGRTGRGIREHFDLQPTEVDIWMGTLSKAFASCGGYIAGCQALIDCLKYAAPGCIMYSAGISPSNTAAALASVKKLLREPQHVQQLQENAELFLTLASQAGLDTGMSTRSPNIPVLIRDSILCLRLAETLFRQKINVHPILYPAVPEKDARLRFFISARHTPKQIRQTISVLSRELTALHKGKE